MKLRKEVYENCIRCNRPTSQPGYRFFLGDWVELWRSEVKVIDNTEYGINSEGDSYPVGHPDITYSQRYYNMFVAEKEVVACICPTCDRTLNKAKVDVPGCLGSLFTLAFLIGLLIACLVIVGVWFNPEGKSLAEFIPIVTERGGENLVYFFELGQALLFEHLPRAWNSEYRTVVQIPVLCLATFVLYSLLINIFERVLKSSVFKSKNRHAVRAQAAIHYGMRGYVVQDRPNAYERGEDP